MRIGEVLRYKSDKKQEPDIVDGKPNFWHVTATPHATRAQLDAGIDRIAKVNSPDGPRVPAILLGSSPHKVGSVVTPWQDTIDPDFGYAFYYGDSKASHDHAPDTDGNLEMLEAFSRHSSPDRATRLKAEPLIIFERVPEGKIRKGYVKFSGIGVIDQVHLMTQIDPKSRRPFVNYAFDLVIFDLSAEREEFSWDWVTARRSKDRTDEECLALAPQSWRKWVGGKPIQTVRRSVARISKVPTKEQQPAPQTAEARILKDVLSFYEGRKHRFEAVAELIAQSVIGAGNNYTLGWISPRGHDFGIDFVGRLDIGDDFAKTSLIVLGQAKCERQKVTSATDIARTVARLQRGWFGCYVTTSSFSEAVQQEVVEDKYPLTLVHGLRVAQEVRKMSLKQGLTTLQLLQKIDATYEERLAQRRPEQVLLL